MANQGATWWQGSPCPTRPSTKVSPKSAHRQLSNRPGHRDQQLSLFIYIEITINALSRRSGVQVQAQAKCLFLSLFLHLVQKAKSAKKSSALPKLSAQAMRVPEWHCFRDRALLKAKWHEPHNIRILIRGAALGRGRGSPGKHPLHNKTIVIHEATPSGLTL